MLLHDHAQLFVFTEPWPVYAAFAGLFEQFVHEPALVPVQLPRYCPTAQFVAHLGHLKPLPELWLHLPVRYLPEAHVWLEQLTHLPSSW